LLWPFPLASGLSRRNSPYGEVRTHDLQVGFERRFSKGFNLYFAYTRLSDRDIFLNEFDPEPSWRESNNGRPPFTAACSRPASPASAATTPIPGTPTRNANSS